MQSTRSTTASALFVAAFALASCEASATDRDRMLDWKVSAVAQLEDPSNSLSPAPWGIVADSDRDRIYVVDTTGERVVVFDSAGAKIDEFGRRGSGPGEFERPWAIAIAPTGYLSVVDSRLNRISIWSPQGEALSTRPLPPEYWGPEIADLGDHMVMVTVESTDDPQEIRQNLTEVFGTRERVLATVSQYQTVVKLPCLRNPLPAPKPLAPAPVWTTLGDTVAVVSDEDYRIDLYRAGELLQTFNREVAPITVTEALAIEHIENGQLRILMTRCGVNAQVVANSMDWRATVSPIRRIAVGTDRKLWITRLGNEFGGTRVDALKQDGTYVGTLEGIAEPIAFISEDKYIAFSPDDDTGTRLSIFKVDS